MCDPVDYPGNKSRESTLAELDREGAAALGSLWGSEPGDCQPETVCLRVTAAASQMFPHLFDKVLMC